MGRLILGLLLGITLAACRADKLFPYFYYSLDAMTYTGDLRGPEPADDIPLKSCMPTDADKAPCMVMFTSAFLRLKEAHIKSQIDLIDCQKGRD